MKTLLKIIGALVALFILVSLFLDKTVQIERSIEIEGPVNKVFMKIANGKQWQNWDFWSELDSTIVNSYEGPVYGLGAIRSWTSEESGTGSMTFTNVELNKRIDYTLDFIEPFESHAKGSFTFEQVNGHTKVVWTDTEDFAFHMRFFGLFIEKMIGTAFEKSLANLKELCESSTEKYNIVMYDKAGFDIYSERASCEISEIGKTLEQLYSRLYNQVIADGNDFHSRPICFYHNFTETTVDLEAALPVSITKGKTSQVKTVPAATVIKTTYVGAYDKTQAAYDALDDFTSYNGLKIEASHYQMYITDPGDVQDPSQWVTEIYYSLSK